MIYEIKFEIYGKKMKAKIEANSEEMAERILRHKIKIHSVTKVEQKGYKDNADPRPMDDDMFNSIFGGVFKDTFGP